MAVKIELNESEISILKKAVNNLLQDTIKALQGKNKINPFNGKKLLKKDFSELEKRKKPLMELYSFIYKL